MKKLDKIALNPVDGFPYENSHYMHYGDYDIHYTVDEAKGEEKAKMFLIHGFMCNTSFFDEVTPLFTAAGIKCVRIDLPDFGYTTREMPDINYIPRTELVVKVMEDLDTDKTGWIVLGHSMGGGVALDVALAAPKMVNAILLNCPFFLPNVPDFLGNLVMIKPMRDIMDIALDYLFAHETVEKMVIALMTVSRGYTQSYPHGVMGGPFALENSGDGLCYMTAKSKGMNMKALADLEMPIHLITGKMDAFVMPTKVIKLKKYLPDSLESVSYLMGGHCLIQDKADKVATDNLGFLKKKGLL